MPHVKIATKQAKQTLEQLHAELAEKIGDNKREAKITYAETAKRLKKHGFKAETEASITNKLKRGMFPATFFLVALPPWNWTA
jgi:uncharacterized protein DUF6471